MISVVRYLWPDQNMPLRNARECACPWRVVVVAANPMVHDAIAMVLAGGNLLGRPIEVSHAACAAEAQFLFLGGRWLPLELDNRSGSLGIHVYLEISERSGDFQVALREVVAELVQTALRAESLLDRLRSLQYYDQLCQLPNRPLFISMLEEALQGGGDWVVAIVDIDHFSSLTNALGYPLGDALLKSVAVRLQDSLEPSGYRLARIGTDNFAMLSRADQFDYSRVLGLFKEPLEALGYPLHISATMGMAYTRDVRGGAEDVLKSAATALKSAKQQSRGSYRCFSPTMAEEIEERVRLAYDLKNALADHAASHRGLVVHYQPQVDLGSGRPIGAEALIRWQHPELGMIMPDRFIFIAERAGLIVELGEFVLEQACRDQVAMQRRGLPKLRMAVNVSMQQFRSPRFVPAVRRILAETGIDPGDLELEITESMLAGDLQEVVGALYAIKALGVSIALDDFGTGFSSLSHLRTLPIDRLKIDRLFVRDIREGNAGAKIAEMIVSLARTLGKEIIAEGIEESDVIPTLRSWGCEEGQGYLFGKAMACAPLENWIGHRADRPE